MVASHFEPAQCCRHLLLHKRQGMTHFPPCMIYYTESSALAAAALVNRRSERAALVHAIDAPVSQVLFCRHFFPVGLAARPRRGYFLPTAHPFHNDGRRPAAVRPPAQSVGGRQASLLASRRRGDGAGGERGWSRARQCAQSLQAPSGSIGQYSMATDRQHAPSDDPVEMTVTKVSRSVVYGRRGLCFVLWVSVTPIIVISSAVSRVVRHDWRYPDLR